MAFQTPFAAENMHFAVHSQACLMLEQSMTEFCLPLARALEGGHENVNLVFYVHLLTSKSPFCSFSIDLWLMSFGFDVIFSLFLRKIVFSNICPVGVINSITFRPSLT